MLFLETEPLNSQWAWSGLIVAGFLVIMAIALMLVGSVYFLIWIIKTIIKERSTNV